MSRPLDAAITAELQAAVINPLYFVQLEFDAGTLYLHTDLGSITTLSQTWIGVGDLGTVGTIEENIDLGAVSVQMTLSAIDATLLDEALNNNYQQRPVVIYIGMRNTITGALTVQPHEIFSGKISEQLVTPSTITLTAESEMALWDRAANQFFTDSTQQRLFAGDLGLIFVPRMTDLTIKWGDPSNPTQTIGDRWGGEHISEGTPQGGT